MSIKTGRFVIYKDGQVFDASGSWKIGPVVSSSQVAGVDATLQGHRQELVSVMEQDFEEQDLNSDPIEIFWEDDEGSTRVFMGQISRSSGGSLEAPTYRLTDGTERLGRALDLRPMAWTLPVHPMLAGHGGQRRHVGLFGVWFTHQAMVHSGFDPGVPMHWSSVWYQSNCGSVTTVPDRFHAFASLGDVRQARRLSIPDVAPDFSQGETQIVAGDLFVFGVTSPNRPGTYDLPWQMTWDLPIDGGNDGEIVLRNLGTAAGLAVKWSTNNMSFYKHNSSGTQDLLGTVVRDRSSNGDKRWSVVASPSGSTVIVRTDARGEVARWEGIGTIHPLPTGKNGLCTIRETVPGRLGAVAVTRGDRHYMTTEPPKGVIFRKSLTATSLPGWPYMPGVEAGRILADQADAHRGLRGQPIWNWINEDGLLVNTDFDTLASRPVVREFDTRPGSEELALDKLEWETNPSGGPYSGVEVSARRMSVALRDRPTLLLGQGKAQGLTNGDPYEDFVTAESGTTWLEPDLRPLMAGWPYPSPPYDPRYKNALNREEKSWVGGHRFFQDGGERRGWLHPYQMSWTVDALGHVIGALRQITPDTIIAEGTAVLPTGQWPQDASTSPDPGSEGLFARRKDQPFPQVRGFGLMKEVDLIVESHISGVDDRHTPLRHDVGFWIQSNTGVNQITSYLREQLERPTPTRTAKVEQTGWVKAGDKVRLWERRRNGIVIQEEIVVTPIEGSTFSQDDSMMITGVVTSRKVTQTDPDAPPVDREEEWVTPPPTIIPEPPPSTTPPAWEDDPPHNPSDPPGTGPVKPSTPVLAYDSHGLLTVAWDGSAAAGGSAVTAYFGSAEVALSKELVPEEVVGLMWAVPDDSFLFTEPSIDYGTQWYTRIRIVDRWGRVSPWSDVAGPAEVVPLVDPGQFEDLELLLDQTRDEIADSGVILDGKLVDLGNEIDAAELRLDDAEADLVIAQNQIDDAAEWIDITGTQLGTRLGTAEGKLSTAFPSGPFDVDAAIDAAVSTGGGNVTTYTNVTAGNKPGPAPTSTTGRKAGDIHRNRNQTTYEVYAEWMLGTSGTWQPVNFGNLILRSLDVGKITGGAGAFADFVADNFVGNDAVINNLWVDLFRGHKITADQAIIGSGENMLPWNPQRGVEPHTGYGGNTLTPSNDADLGWVYQANAENVTPGTWTTIVRFFPDAPARNGRLGSWDVSEGEQFRLRVGVGRGGSYPLGTPAKRFLVQYQDQAGARTGAWVGQETAIGAFNSTQEYIETMTGPAPAGTVTMDVFLQADNPGICFLYNGSIKRAADSSLIVDGGVTAKKITITGDPSNPDEAGLVANIASIMELDVKNLRVTGTGTLDEAVISKLWTDVVRSKKITADMVLIGSGVNLVVDPGFTNPELNAYRLNQAGGTWYYIDADVYVPRRVRPEDTHASTVVFRLFGPSQARYYDAIPDQVYRVRYRARTGGTASTRPAVRCTHQDGSATYTAADQSAFTPLTGTWQWFEYTWTAPTTAVQFAVEIQEAGGASGWSNYASPSVVVDGASLIVDGTLAARHINALSIAGAVGEFVKVKANNILTGLMEATLTISGRIQTSASGRRAVMDSTGFAYYDPFNRPLFQASSDGVTLVGALDTGVSTTGIRIHPDSSYWGDGAIEFRHPNFTSASRRPAIFVENNSAFGAHLSIKGPGLLDGIRLSEDSFTVGPTGKIDMEAGYAGMLLRSDGDTTVQGGASRFGGANELILKSDLSTFLTGVGAGSTTSNATNVHVALNGRIRRSTSLSQHKLAQEPFKGWAAVRDLRPVTWIDRSDAEDLAAAIESGDQDAYASVGSLTRQVGLIAEEVEAAGVTGLATYTGDGALAGVAYERLAVALLPWLHDLEDRINRIEEKS